MQFAEGQISNWNQPWCGLFIAVQSCFQSQGAFTANYILLLTKLGAIGWVFCGSPRSTLNDANY